MDADIQKTIIDRTFETLIRGPRAVAMVEVIPGLGGKARLTVPKPKMKPLL